MTPQLDNTRFEMGSRKTTEVTMTVSSPTSVLAAQEASAGVLIEPIVLGEQLEQEPWVCPASAKSTRTINPIRAIVDPIAKQIKTGEQRGDGKDLISLAVSTVRSKGCCHL